MTTPAGTPCQVAIRALRHENAPWDRAARAVPTASAVSPGRAIAAQRKDGRPSPAMSARRAINAASDRIASRTPIAGSGEVVARVAGPVPPAARHAAMS